MARTDANPPMMPYTDEYTLVEVDADYLTKAVKPKQFIHIDQTECIMCEGCVDICPWKCIHMVHAERHRRGDRHRAARRGPVRPGRVHHRRRHLHPVRAVRRPVPDRRDHPRQGRRARRRRRLPHPHQQPRLRLRHEVLSSDSTMSERSDGQDHRRAAPPDDRRTG